MSGEGDGSARDPIEELKKSIKDFQKEVLNFTRQVEKGDVQIIAEEKGKEKEKEYLDKVADLQRWIAEILNDYVPLAIVAGRTCQALDSRLKEATGQMSKLTIERQEIKEMDNVHHDIGVCRYYIRLSATTERKALITGRRLLSLDGGGVRGICSLVVLQKLMEKIEEIDNEDKELKDEESEGRAGKVQAQRKADILPQDYFDLAGGTSTGGLIGIMLFRLGMSPKEAIEQYETLSREIFKRGITFAVADAWNALRIKPWYSGDRLEAQVKDVLGKNGVSDPENEQLMMPKSTQESNPKCQMFVCTVKKKGNMTVNFRTYTPYSLSIDGNIHCTIVEAARATSAAPFYFPAKEIQGQTYWDGGLQNNNPICQVLAETGPGMPAVLVSLGTGLRPGDEKGQEQPAANGTTDPLDADTNPGKRPERQRPWYKQLVPYSLTQLSALGECLTNCENQHRAFERVLDYHKVPYHRFNPHIDEDVGLHDYSKLGKLRGDTESWLKKPKVDSQLKDVAKILLRKLDPLDPLAINKEEWPRPKQPNKFGETLKGAWIDDYKRIPLWQAAQNGHDTIVELLLEEGANIELKDSEGRTALLWAALKRHEAIIKLLLKKGANVDSKDNRGWTPLLWAAENGHDTIVELLLEEGANIELKDSEGQTPLLWATEKGHEAIVKLLLEKGANVDSKDNRGWTPLLWAAEKGYETIIKLLLEKGANVELKDNEGQTPLLWATEKGRKPIVKLLRENGANVDSKDNQGSDAAVVSR